MEIHEDILLVDVDDVTQPPILVLSGVDRLSVAVIDGFCVQVIKDVVGHATGHALEELGGWSRNHDSQDRFGTHENA